jgi:hypothetical protein
VGWETSSTSPSKLLNRKEKKLEIIKVSFFE